MEDGWGRARNRYRPVNPQSAGKVPPAQAFFDVSDLVGPAGRWLAVHLADTPVSPLHLTLAFTLAGLLAAFLLAIGQGLWLAALLVVLKSALDAADGGLARARGRPSRVGRFLDSDCDFVVNVALYAGLAVGLVGRGGSPVYILLAFLALVSGMLQVSLYNHYYIAYRLASGGDHTSQLSEVEPAGYAWDNSALLTPLFVAYSVIYGWQDALVARLDQWAAPQQPVVRRGFMSAVGVLGLGTQMLLLAACALLGHMQWALWALVIGFNAYAALLLYWRRRQTR